MKKENVQQLTVKGIVIPEKWDVDGSVIGVALQDFDENEYLVEDSFGMEDLIPMLQKEVEVIGITKRRMGGRTLIRILEFREVKSA